MSKSAKKKSNKNADEAPDVPALALVKSNPLADWGEEFLDDMDDGFGENDAEDQRLGSIVWNSEGERGSGANTFELRKSQFFDTVDETAVEELRLILLYKVKSQLLEERDEAEDRKERLCRSFDRKNGEPTERAKALYPDLSWKCDPCPKRVWDGRNPPACAAVLNVYVLNLETGQPRRMRFLKSSYKPFNDHLNKHHTGKIFMGGRRRNVPLCAYEVKVTLRSKKGKAGGLYYVPVFDVVRTLTRDEAMEVSGLARTMREHEKALREFEDREEPDTSFPPAGSNDDFRDDDGATTDRF